MSAWRNAADEAADVAAQLRTLRRLYPVYPQGDRMEQAIQARETESALANAPYWNEDDVVTGWLVGDAEIRETGLREYQSYWDAHFRSQAFRAHDRAVRKQLLRFFRLLLILPL